MDDATAGQIFKACYEYTETGRVPELGPVASLLFEFFKSDIDRAKIKHAEMVEARSRAGKKGALAKHNKAKQSQAKPGKRGELEQEPNKKQKWIGIDE